MEQIAIEEWMSLAQLMSTSPRISQLTSRDEPAVPAGTRSVNGNGNTSPCAARHGPLRTRKRSHTWPVEPPFLWYSTSSTVIDATVWLSSDVNST